jgi:hypothetical protein
VIEGWCTITASPPQITDGGEVWTVTLKRGSKLVLEVNPK